MYEAHEEFLCVLCAYLRVCAGQREDFVVNGYKYSSSNLYIHAKT